MILLDANVLVYYLDETAGHHAKTISRLQELVDSQEQLVTSHHVVEEVLFVISKLSHNANLQKVVERISEIPSLLLVEPAPNLEFSKRYAKLSSKLGMGLNDALLLQLMLDAGITKVFSFDKQFVNKAASLSIETVV